MQRKGDRPSNSRRKTGNPKKDIGLPKGRDDQTWDFGYGESTGTSTGIVTLDDLKEVYMNGGLRAFERWFNKQKVTDLKKFCIQNGRLLPQYRKDLIKQSLLDLLTTTGG